MLRPKGTPTPCHSCPKIPRSAPLRTPQFAVELSPRNRRAWQHYEQCRAVGQFPDDPIVRRNAAICASVLQSIQDMKLDRLYYLMGGSDDRP